MPFQLKMYRFNFCPTEKGYMFLGQAKIYTLLLILLNSSVSPYNFDRKLPYVLDICWMCEALELLVCPNVWLNRCDIGLNGSLEILLSMANEIPFLLVSKSVQLNYALTKRWNLCDETSVLSLCTIQYLWRVKQYKYYFTFY